MARYAPALAAALILITVGCSASAAGKDSNKELLVFAASSLTEAFRDLSAEFEKANPGVKVALNFAGSQRLSTQLEHGARADVFASADWGHMDSVVQAGLVSGDPTNFTSNRLVVIASSRQARIGALEDLSCPGTRLVLGQSEAPVGVYSRKAINSLATDAQFGPDYAAQVLGNVVSEETNVRSVAQKVALGEADAGIVYQTDVMSRDIRERVRVIPIPEPHNVTASYPIAALKESRQPELARKFINFTLSKAGQRILERNGFGPARDSEITGVGFHSGQADGQ